MALSNFSDQRIFGKHAYMLYILSFLIGYKKISSYFGRQWWDLGISFRTSRTENFSMFRIRLGKKQIFTGDPSWEEKNLHRSRQILCGGGMLGFWCQSYEICGILSSHRGRESQNKCCTFWSV